MPRASGTGFGGHQHWPERTVRRIQSPLAATANSFGGASLSALCLGVTGCCYLAGARREEKLLKDLRAGAPHVITAAQAIRLLLEAFGCRRVALVAYPAWVVELAKTYWQSSNWKSSPSRLFPMWCPSTSQHREGPRRGAWAYVGCGSDRAERNGRGDLAGD
jgi:hypothetical protein